MSAQKPMISPYEVNELTKYCLNILTYTDELRSDTALKQAYEKAKELENSIRKLKIASLMENKTLICVAGMQGAGKTTLMKNFYGLKGDALSIELGRGERIPVLITETDVTAPVMNAIRIQKNEAGEYAAVECNMEANEFAHASKGEDNSILYLEMFVPYRHTYNSAVSFMLLPGFEKNNDYWRELINFAVNSSDAAVFAFDESRFSQGDNFEQLKKLDIPFEAHVYSAHRTPAEAAAFAASARESGFGVLIAAAGKAAHLAGALAAQTTLPVIGIPVKSSTLDGLDALLSTVQMPSGMPVATVAIDGAANAALLAAQILAVEDETLAEKLLAMRKAQHDAVIAKDAALIVE